MRTLIIPKGKGKTTRLIKKSAVTGDYIVCFDYDEAVRIQMEAQKMGLKIPLPITFKDFLEKRYYGNNIPGFLIDNIDIILESLSYVPIDSITVSS